MSGPRRAGVMLPLSSLPSRHGVGDVGVAAYAFVDGLAACGAAYWQILPFNPLGYGNSPYQPYSSFAGDPLYISLDALHAQGLLPAPAQDFAPDAEVVEYHATRIYKEAVLWEAFSAFVPDAAYESFIKQAWVFPYAVFMAFKRDNDMRCWNAWPEAQKWWPRDRGLDLSPFDEAIRFEMFLQYVFYTQWMALKHYANGLGVSIIGDIPIYVGIDSLDVWAEPDNFLLDEKGEPLFVAGVPPDYFSATGQRWGNPIYNWPKMEQDGFRFWVERLRYSGELFDVVRIDHFRGFDTYWKIPASCPTAVEGEWVEAPGYALFDTVLATVPGLSIIAEDLGMLREEVYRLRDHYAFPGMNILQFTLDAKKPLAPHEGAERMVVYTGTHDNQTMMDWYRAQPLRTRWVLRLRLRQAGYRQGSVASRFARLALDNPGETAILPASDVMGLDGRARINTPGTVGPPNWTWKLRDLNALLKALESMAGWIQESGRG